MKRRSLRRLGLGLNYILYELVQKDLPRPGYHPHGMGLSAHHRRGKRGMCPCHIITPQCQRRSIPQEVMMVVRVCFGKFVSVPMICTWCFVLPIAHWWAPQ